MTSQRVLVQVNSSFDFYMLTSLMLDKRNSMPCDLLAPNSLIARIPKYLLDNYEEIIGFDARLKNLLSFRALAETVRISMWARERRHKYATVVFGSYRDIITSLLAKWFTKKSKLIAIKQGVDRSSDNYSRVYSLRGLHDRIYFYIFGYSFFHNERLIEAEERASYIFDRPVWDSDPFDPSMDVFTIGTEQVLTDGTSFVLPNLAVLASRNKDARRGILIIGERTPMTPSWGEYQDEILARVFAIITDEFKDETIFVRARKNLTNTNFYGDLNPVFLDPSQPYDDQLLKLNPRVVVAVKSTAVKVAAHYDFNSILLFPVLKLSSNEKVHLDHLFGDGASITYINDLEKFKLSVAKANNYSGLTHNADLNNNFFDRLNGNSN